MENNRVSPPRFVARLRIGLHIVVAGIILLTIWKAVGLADLAQLRAAPEIIKGPIVVAIFVGSVALIYAYDRIFLSIVLRFYGRDPHELHWSERVNRDGSPTCPDCGSAYLYGPDSGKDEDYVRCGDCGCAIATLEEMRPFFEKRVPEIARLLTQGIWRH